MSVEVRGVCKDYGIRAALDDVSLTVPTGKLVALLGPSGSGKTTLLRAIAGLEQPDAGTILFHGEDVSKVPLRERRVGFVFQHYALFRHMTVFDNIAFGLRAKRRRERPSRPKIADRVFGLLELVQLHGYAGRYPHQLSGGQRQRVALARALAVQPRVLLLDEPFGALDAQVRHELRRWLRRLHDEIKVTSLFVTHDQEEALDVADTVVVMNEGRVEQIGAPGEVFHAPATRFVMGFLGQVNRLPARVRQGRLLIGPIDLPAPGHEDETDAPATVFVRPHDLLIVPVPDGRPALQARITRVHSAGGLVRIELRGPGGVLLLAELSPHELKSQPLHEGAAVGLLPRAVRFFIDKHPVKHPVEHRVEHPPKQPAKHPAL